jgi:hypothetical protein
VRPGCGRKKKLIVAFHFQFANQSGWNCDTCRRNGLESKRRCGFIAEELRGEQRIVWGRRQVHTEECPRSFIRGGSTSLVEEFIVRRRLGIGDTLDLDAKKVDAFLILREQMEREEADGTTQRN